MRQDSRQTMVQAGVDVVYSGVDLKALTVQSIIKTVDLSSGAFYGQWETLDAYLASVLEAVLQDQMEDARNHHQQVQDLLISPRGPLSPLANLIESQFAQPRQLHGYNFCCWLWARSPHWLPFRKTLYHGDQVIRNIQTGMWADILRGYDLSLREPFTTGWLAGAVSAWYESVMLRQSGLDEAYVDFNVRLLSDSIHSLVLAVTTPAPAG